MGSRYQFIREELEKIYDKLNTSYECVNLRIQWKISGF